MQNVAAGSRLCIAALKNAISHSIATVVLNPSQLQHLDKGEHYHLHVMFLLTPRFHVDT